MRHFAFLVLCFSCVSVSRAAVAVESSIRAADNTTAASTSSPVNVSNDARNTLLIVFVGAFDNTTFGDTAVNSVTFNSVGLTKIHEQIQPTTNRRVTTWCMVAPVSGIHTLTTTWAGAPVGGHVHALLVSGADQTCTVDSSTGTNTAAAASFVATTRTIHDNALVASFCSSSVSALTGQGGSQITIQRSSNNFWWDSYTAPAVAGSVTHTYSNGTTDAAAIDMISIAPPTFSLTINGPLL